MAVSKTDLAIIGAGPTGLMAALTAARCNISVRIFEKRPDVVPGGYADGLWSRTIEIVDSLGLAEKLVQGGHSAPFCTENWWVRLKASSF